MKLDVGLVGDFKLILGDMVSARRQYRKALLARKVRQARVLGSGTVRAKATAGSISMKRKPKADKAYWFVKRTESGISAKMFVRFSDGSGYIYPDLDGIEYDGTWEELWDSLADESYVAEQDAKLQGLIPSDWPPPQVPWFPTR